MQTERSPGPTRFQVRVALIVLANVVALAVLARVFGGHFAARASDPRPSAPPVASSAPELAVRHKRAEPSPKLREFERALRTIVDQAIEKADGASRGRVNASNTTVAVHVRRLDGDDEGVGIEADRAMRPASNLKLVTTAAALVLLGPDWKFETPAEASGPIANGVLEGDLVLRAGGDPLYDRSAHGRVDHLLAPLVAEIARSGVREVRGDLVLDEGAFQDPAPAPAWPPSNQYWQEYCALAAGFSANRGCITVTVSPTSVGERAIVAVEPRALDLAATIDVTTVAKGALTIRMIARDGGFSVRGTIPKGAEPWTDSCSHPDPVALFGACLRAELERGGVHVAGKLRRERGARGGATIARLETPLARYLAAINTDSTNAVADQVFFATARAVRGEASREAGAKATAAALAKLGVQSEGLVQVDGSGLSRDDRVTARQMTALVEAVLSGDVRTAAPYLDSLAIAGESGTLDERLRASPARGRVHAKTGFIAGTSALCGVAEALDGVRYVFSILVDYPPRDGLNSSCWKPMEDEICELLVGAGS